MYSLANFSLLLLLNKSSFTKSSRKNDDVLYVCVKKKKVTGKWTNRRVMERVDSFISRLLDVFPRD